MKRVLLWLLMVLAFTALVLGGALGFFWLRADERALPPAGVSLAGQDLGEPAGYHWRVPVLGGVLWREVSLSPSIASAELAPITTAAAPLVLAQDMTAAGTTLTLKSAGGVTVFEGTAAEWEGFTFPQNGDYTLTIRAGRPHTPGPGAKPEGYYQYQCRFRVEVRPTLTLSTAQAAQGQVVAVYVSGILGSSSPPAAQCELGPVWFRPTAKGWLGYLPVTYNASGGPWPITVTVGDEALTAEVSVRDGGFASTAAGASDPAPAGAEEEFRRVVWAQYELGGNTAYWSGAFRWPVEGGSVFQPYGAYLTRDGQSAGRAANLTLLAPANALVQAPAAGRVAYAGQLLLTGNTVILDHGCGVKSYLFGLESLAGVSAGQTVTAGQGLGVAKRTLIWEVRIGNKSVDPAALTRGGDGLFYRPVGDELL